MLKFVQFFPLAKINAGPLRRAPVQDTSGGYPIMNEVIQ